MSINWELPIQTKSGLKAKLLHELNVGSFRYVVVVRDENQHEAIFRYSFEGKFSELGASIFDLENGPEILVRYQVYNIQSGYFDTSVIDSDEVRKLKQSSALDKTQQIIRFTLKNKFIDKIEIVGLDEIE